jgi:rhodanese-related sulfurtransferase
MTIEPQSTMKEILESFPGAQRALFRKYHIGGCSSCGFQPTESLESLCKRNNNLNVTEVIDFIRSSHEEDLKLFITAQELNQLIKKGDSIKLLDIRSRDEWNAVRIEGSILFSEEIMQEMLSKWSRNQFVVIYDHKGTRSLDAAAYFVGHGFQNVRGLKGGIDSWSQEVDEKLPRYELA